MRRLQKILSIFLVCTMVVLPVPVLAGESPPQGGSSSTVEDTTLEEQVRAREEWLRAQAAQSQTTGQSDIPEEVVAETSEDDWQETQPVLALDAQVKDALLNTAAKDGAGAAVYINSTFADNDDLFLVAVKEVLNLYYAEDSSANTKSQLAAFAQAIDARGAQTVQEYANAAAERAAEGSLPYVPGEVLVVFEGSVGSSQAEAVAQSMDASIEQEISASAETVGVVDISLGQTVEQAVEQLNADPAIAYAQPVFIYQLDEDAQAEAAPPVDDTYLDKQWHLEKIGVFDAWNTLQNLQLSRSRVRVAMLDTPIQLDHPDLSNNINTSLARDFGTGEESTEYPSAVSSGSNHGTHVAGVLGATANNSLGVAGAASGKKNTYIEIIPINVFTEGSGFTTATTVSLIEAVDWAVSSGAKVINMSLGYAPGGNEERDQLLADTIEKAVDSGVVVVASAGNAGNTYLQYPSDLDSVISVINVMNRDYTDASVNPRNTGSNYGPQKNISAPGTAIASTYLTNKSTAGYEMGYGESTGTSMAAPMVSAVVAMMLYANPSLSAAQIQEILYSTATDLYTPGRDDQTGWGCVNAAAAVAAAAGVSPSTTIKINETNFPDAAFRAYVAELMGGTEMTSADASRIESIEVDSLGIKSLQGIEYFKSLKTLSCKDNQLKELDLSGNAALQTLNCSGNQIPALSLEANTALQTTAAANLAQTVSGEVPDSHAFTLADLVGEENLANVTIEQAELSRVYASYNKETGVLAFTQFGEGGATLKYTYKTKTQNGPQMPVTLKLLPEGQIIDSPVYIIKDGIVTNVQPGTTAAQFIDNLSTPKVSIRDDDDEAVASDEQVGTGMRVQTVSSSTGATTTATIVIYGDVDGNGLITAEDILLTQQYLLKNAELEGPYLQAAAVESTKPDALSLLQMQRHVLSLFAINQSK